MARVYALVFRLELSITGGGRTIVANDGALDIISSVVANLKSAGRIKSTVEPSDILTNLINHHLLVHDNEDDGAIRFRVHINGAENPAFVIT